MEGRPGGWRVIPSGQVVPLTSTAGETVILDVGGERFTAKRDLLLQRPTTRLGQLMEARDAEDVVQVLPPPLPRPVTAV